MPDLRQDIAAALAHFQTLPLKDASRQLLARLGYKSDKFLSGAGSRPQDFLKDFASGHPLDEEKKALVPEWKSADLIFQLTDEELSRESTLFTDGSVHRGLLKSYIFIAIELKGADYARGKFSGIARQINRLIPMPVMVVFKHGDQLTIAALITPDLDFWDNEASPITAQCLETLSERCGELYIRMESERPEPAFYEHAPDGFDGIFTTAPLRRWQRIPTHGPLPWENAVPIPDIHSAPQRIALHRSSKDAGGTRLSIYHLRPDSLSPLLAENARLDNVPLFLRAKLQLESGAEATFLVGQASPLLAPIGLPWSGAPDARYFGPLFPVGWMTGGWSPHSAWPKWEGPILPLSKVPGFDSFLVANGRVQRADGAYFDALEKLIRVQRGARYKDAPARFEFDTGIVVPLTFRMQIDDLKKIKGLAVEIIADQQELNAQLDHFAKKDSKVCSSVKK
jgi:hypothetical protein